MHSVWLSLKTNVKCGCRQMDVIPRPGDSGKEGSDTPVVHRGQEQVSKVNFRLNDPQNWYSELKSGDPSRKIIEMIYQAASSSPSKPCRDIKKVMRVNNSSEKVHKFEKYRGVVKTRACEQENTHLRSVVDGNELLQFYSTTINCCKKEATKVTEPCKDVSCRVCRIIQSGFDNTKNGIMLSTSSEELSKDVARGKHAKRAVIVCRTIAGRMTNVIASTNSQEYDSVKIEALYSDSGYLIVQNPSAVLPCFVIVFN